MLDLNVDAIKGYELQECLGEGTYETAKKDSGPPDLSVRSSGDDSRMNPPYTRRRS